MFTCDFLPFTYCSSPSSQPHEAASLSFIAPQPSEDKTAKSPKHQDSPTIILPVWWLRWHGDFAVSHMLLHACLWIHTVSFPSHCLSAFALCGYKKKIHTLMPVAFPEGGERHWVFFTVVKNETQENFSTATWEMQVSSKNQSVPLVPTHTTRLAGQCSQHGSMRFCLKKIANEN